MNYFSKSIVGEEETGNAARFYGAVLLVFLLKDHHESAFLLIKNG